MRKGFGLVGFLCNDLTAAIEANSKAFDIVTPVGSHAISDTVAVVRDPDGYLVELIQQGSALK